MGVRCCKNPVSLQSKHGLAYNLDESGAGCLQNVCEQSGVRSEERGKTEVQKEDSQNFLKRGEDVGSMMSRSKLVVAMSCLL